MQVIKIEPLRKQLTDMWWEALPKNDDGRITLFNGELVSNLRADIIKEIVWVIENQEKIEVDE